MRLLISAVFAVFLLVGLARHAGQFLVINQPERSDVMVVLDGDENDQRYQRALELLQEGYASELVVDKRSDLQKFGRTPATLEQEFIDRSAGPLRSNIRVCPTTAQSTQEEAIAVAGCLNHSVSRALLVTSDYHTRRALNTFRRQLPQYQFSVVAVHDRSSFSPDGWWRRREWAKTTVLEWTKLVWWEMVDRWRTPG